MNFNDINYVCAVPTKLILPDVVYKYRSINEFLFRSLLLNQIWLAKPESFNDPFETERIFSGTPFSQELDRDIRQAGVFCLCKSNENFPMWSYYGDGLRGVAIGYDLTELLRSLNPVEPCGNECTSRWKYVFDLDYCDNGLSEIDERALLRNDKLTDVQRQKMFATKSEAFRHEQECRIVVQPSPNSKPEFAWHGYGLYGHHSSAIREIVFGELVSKPDREAIKQIMAGRDITFSNAVRAKKSFKIHVVGVEEV